MTDDILADLDFDSLNAEATATKGGGNPPVDSQEAQPKLSASKPKEESPPAPLENVEPEAVPPATKSSKRPLWEILSILGGVFLVVGLFAWIMMTFVFVETPESENVLELPRNRMEAMMMELPIREIQSQKISKNPNGNNKPTVFIVEIDASIVVKGTSSELVEVETLLKSHHARVEEVIEETIRAASDANLNEPEMLVIRTRIRDRINEFFDRPMVKEVIFGHYRAFHTPIKM